MRRVLNEATSDEKRKAMYGYGGVKMGDYGTGGRVYTSRYRAGPGGDSGPFVKIIAFVLLMGAAYFMFDSERRLYQVMGASDEAAELAVTIPADAVDLAVDDKLVFLATTTAPVAAAPPSDSFFGVTMRNDHGVIRRVTEYCQWQEIEHRERHKVGQDPDYCRAATKASGDERCQGVRCGGLSQQGCGASACCEWNVGDDVYEVKVWYTYVKGWRPERINSLLFDNPAAYHNPSRDPAPPETFYAGGVGLAAGGGGLKIAASDLLPAMDRWSALPILETPRPSRAALDAGFGEADHLHFYSRVPADGVEHPGVRAAASWLVDGVLDLEQIARGVGLEALLERSGLGWITKGTCHAGDIRVRHEGRRLPARGLSLIGAQERGGRIAAHTYTNGVTKIFVRAGVMDAATLLALEVGDESTRAMWARAGCVVTAVIGGCFAWAGSPQRGAIIAATALVALLTALWSAWYGWDDAVAPGIATLIGCALSMICSGKQHAKSKFL